VDKNMARSAVTILATKPFQITKDDEPITFWAEDLHSGLWLVSETIS
jgi:hypothetical protein